MNKNEQKDEKTTSFFEFWPGWIMYLPVVVQWLVLGLKHRSLTLPFLANPELHLSGMVGVPKSALMSRAKGRAAETILPWIAYPISESVAALQAEKCIAQAANAGIKLPFACKPDIGCRGVGVKLVESKQQLTEIIASYPPHSRLLCQKLASYESEVGIFYVRDPKSGRSKIPSMTLKTLPRVVGDGKHTLGELVGRDPRAGKLSFLYYERHKNRWNSVPKMGESVRLVFSASHSKGAIFTDARGHITPQLTEAITQIMQGLPNFYYGRLDVKFRDLQSLKLGQNLEVVEINGASAESIHIWDKNTRFTEAMRALLWQYRTLFTIGAHHRARGLCPPSLSEFLTALKTERRLTKYYPLTD